MSQDPCNAVQKDAGDPDNEQYREKRNLCNELNDHHVICLLPKIISIRNAFSKNLPFGIPSFLFIHFHCILSAEFGKDGRFFS